MSKMNEISLEIGDMLTAGINPEAIAEKLKVPITWVYATQELSYEQEITEYDPFITVNS